MFQGSQLAQFAGESREFVPRKFSSTHKLKHGVNMFSRRKGGWWLRTKISGSWPDPAGVGPSQWRGYRLCALGMASTNRKSYHICLLLTMSLVVLDSIVVGGWVIPNASHPRFFLWQKLWKPKTKHTHTKTSLIRKFGEYIVTKVCMLPTRDGSVLATHVTDEEEIILRNIYTCQKHIRVHYSLVSEKSML
jgi:hypothetical protein